MSDRIKNQIAAGMAKANTKLTAAFAPTGVRCFLLRRNSKAQGYGSLREVTSGFFSDWSDFREQTRFLFATTDATFDDDFTAATHVAYGTGSALQVYSISDEQRDKIRPDGASPEYKAFATYVQNERFTP